MNILEVQRSQLKEAATKALKTPYPLDAQTVFAAAVLTKQGNVFASAQYFSDTYSLTLHAEQSALVHAAAHGEGEIVAIAITSNEPKGVFSYPCHMCKQLLWESSQRSGLDMYIIVFDQYGKEECLLLSEIIAFPWPTKK